MKHNDLKQVIKEAILEALIEFSTPSVMAEDDELKDEDIKTVKSNIVSLYSSPNTLKEKQILEEQQEMINEEQNKQRCSPAIQPIHKFL